MALLVIIEKQKYEIIVYFIYKYTKLFHKSLKENPKTPQIL